MRTLLLALAAFAAGTGLGSIFGAELGTAFTVGEFGFVAVLFGEMVRPRGRPAAPPQARDQPDA
ncbi:MAG: hypothetical protein ACR2NA_00555 [Solirubrobacterales bacterium]